MNRLQKKIASFDFIFSVLIIIISLIIIFISFKINQGPTYFKQDFITGIIVDILMEDVMDDPYVPGRKLGRQNIKVRLLEGEYKNKIFTITNNITKGHNIYAEKGKKYIFTVRIKDNGPVVWLYNYNRAKYLFVLLAIFILLVLLIAGQKGIRSLISLFFTGVMIIFILIPLIFAGYDPILYSILILSVVIIVSFLLISGLKEKTAGAIIGTISGVIFAGLFSFITSRIAHLSGINMEKGEQILYIAQDFNIRINGILFIAILIASLGAIMDIAMSIASAISEIKQHKPDISNKELFISGMNIGHDIIGTMTNTLILAFAGSSFTLILMIAGFRMEFTQFINIPVICIEIIQALSGSIGILLTVPLTNIATIILLKKRRRSYNETK